MMPLVRVTDLVKTFEAPGARFRGPGRNRVVAVDRVSLEVRDGETYALVGESGSGKTTLGRCILRLIDATDGTVMFEGVDLTRARAGVLREARRRMQVVFQDPIGSLDPRMAVRDVVAEPLRTHLRLTPTSRSARVLELLRSVGLDEIHLDRRPHELSGGQCQRVAIARALALSPRLVVLDEPTSSLDVSVQAQILNLLVDLREQHRLTYLLISHDLSVVRHLADRIGVMYGGRIVEEGPADDVLGRPLHPYTRALLAAAPTVGQRRQRWEAASASVAAPATSGGCRYASRCALRVELDRPSICETDDPMPHDCGADRSAACHFAPALSAAQREGARS